MNSERPVSEIKSNISNLACKKRFWNNLHLILSKPKYLKSNNLKVFVNKKTKRYKQDSQYRLKSHMPEKETNFCKVSFCCT